MSDLEALLSPSFYARQSGNAREFDLSHLIGPYHGQRPWPMYSFERAATMVWNALGQRLYERGWTDAEIRTWLQSQDARWALDFDLGDALTAAARACADRAQKA